MGIGAPAHTGGLIQYVNTYGFDEFAARCDALAEAYGERFTCPEIVRQHAKSGELML
jgi:3-hydroxyacyl-CoA dehydrogenase/enoyl-CoA hydratase/3-hydroxybutyryl-CoA epimerase